MGNTKCIYNFYHTFFLWLTYISDKIRCLNLGLHVEPQQKDINDIPIFF